MPICAENSIEVTGGLTCGDLETESPSKGPLIPVGLGFRLQPWGRDNDGFAAESALVAVFS